MASDSRPEAKRFKGYDYIELAEHFGVKYDDDKDGDDVAMLEKFLRSHMRSHRTEEPTPHVVAACREFLVALHNQEKKYGYRAPVYQGLLGVKDDYTFLQVFLDLLPGMWT